MENEPESGLTKAGNITFGCLFAVILFALYAAIIPALSISPFGDSRDNFWLLGVGQLLYVAPVVWYLRKKGKLVWAQAVTMLALVVFLMMTPCAFKTTHTNPTVEAPAK